MENVPPRTVRFRIGDLVHPHPTRVLMELFRNLSLEGEVAAGTTDGETPYLVVRLPGFSEPVVVPQEKTRPVEQAACAPAAGS